MEKDEIQRAQPRTTPCRAMILPVSIAENLGYKFICGCVTLSLPLLKGNDMSSAILTLHFCSIHDLLFCPALQQCLSFGQVQIEHTFGEAMRLTESACPRCTTSTTEVLYTQFPTLYPSSLPRK